MIRQRHVRDEVQPGERAGAAAVAYFRAAVADGARGVQYAEPPGGVVLAHVLPVGRVDGAAEGVGEMAEEPWIVYGLVVGAGRAVALGPKRFPPRETAPVEEDDGVGAVVADAGRAEVGVEVAVMQGGGFESVGLTAAET